MTENAKMQPFDVLIENNSGRVVDFHMPGVLAPLHPASISAGTHRIEHIRDQAALVEELRELSKRLTDADDIVANAFGNEINAILSRHGRE